jgi:hypothetical protein
LSPEEQEGEAEVPLVRHVEPTRDTFPRWPKDQGELGQEPGRAGSERIFRRVIEPAQLICPSGGSLTGLSSLISGFPKNILVPT